MGKHRSRLQILETILSVIKDNEKVRKTQIMYKAYLSYTLLTRYLNDVLDAGLVVQDNNKCFSLTQRGENFVARFGKYAKSCKIVKSTLNNVQNQRSMLEEMCPNTTVDLVERKTRKRNGKK
jgi:predicted transcriptional regulator